MRAARILQIEDFLKRKPRALSGGQRQRVAMGRAIVREPEAFLMDEPLSNLDAKLRVQMRAEIHQLQRRLDVTTIYVTHDQVEAMTMGDRVAVMNAGRLQQVDTPQVLYDQPRNEFVAGFIGSPAINLVEAQLEKTNGHLSVSFGEHRLAVDDRAARNRSGAQRLRRSHDHPRHPARGLRGREHRVGHAQRPAPEGELDLTEPLGADVLVYFGTAAEGVVSSAVDGRGAARTLPYGSAATTMAEPRPASAPASALARGSRSAARPSSRSTRAASTSSTPRRGKRSSP